MKRSTSIGLFVGANVLLLFLHIHKHSQFIKLSYTRQKIELEKTALIKQQQELAHQLTTIDDRTLVKKTMKELGMEPVKIGQIKKISYDTNI